MNARRKVTEFFFPLFFLVSLFPGTAFAGAGAGAAAPKNPLASLPSKPGPRIAKIKALGDNQWLNLGQAAPDPKWGTARGRGYSPKMAYASTLRGAFFCGTGQHGAVITAPDKSKHYMDDLWFYDAMAHRWICLYPGANIKTLKLRLNEHGFEVNEKGESQPVSYLSHAYNQTTFIPDTKQYMVIYRYCPWWTRALPQRGEWLQVPAKDRGNPYRHGKLNIATRHPLFYNVTEGKWERRFIPGRGQAKYGKDLQPPGMGVLEYLPSKKKVIYVANGGVLYFDPFKNTWSDPKAPRAKIKYDSSGCYDSRRERIYVVKNGMWFYDIRAKRWTTVRGKGRPEKLGRPIVTYDTASGVVVLAWYKLASGKSGLRIYDPETNSWTPSTGRPKANYKYKAAHGFYSPELNAHYYYMAGDSNNKSAFWLAYRYKRQPKEKRESK